jgi:hypothetical protein
MSYPGLKAEAGLEILGESGFDLETLRGELYLICGNGPAVLIRNRLFGEHQFMSSVLISRGSNNLAENTRPLDFAISD